MQLFVCGACSHTHANTLPCCLFFSRAISRIIVLVAVSFSFDVDHHGCKVVEVAHSAPMAAAEIYGGIVHVVFMLCHVLVCCLRRAVAGGASPSGFATCG